MQKEMNISTESTESTLNSRFLHSSGKVVLAFHAGEMEGQSGI